eukprot:gnl/TRDRNA2_/TRDRNA2_134860_c0_seq2.p1 gnl/TRDRNA2_/TRDRNA2_134860_c0~~gnl/TRDRNA2_/TRDRNA2_134860_c0_seq2.p1  ORF type:complete len:287 (+),score=60.58 gnl/TRDRNA2_/TRDRNA2_134860_c0_seq2:411-1271(+)
MIREMQGEVFAAFPFEGILGLAFPSLSFGGIKPFFETVIEQKALPRNEFAFYLNADERQPSALLWGGVDRDLYDGDIRMFPVVQPHYWSLELVDFWIGEKSMNSAGGKTTRRLIVDSGTTYFSAPTALYSQILDMLPSASCDKVDNYKPLTFVLRGSDQQLHELQVKQETYMVGDSDNWCHPAFMALDVKEEYGPAMILGEVFMRHFLTVFDRGSGDVSEAQIGFAPARLGAVPKNSEAALTETEVAAPREVPVSLVKHGAAGVERAVIDATGRLGMKPSMIRRES